ncbi:hypothetical protein PV325_013692, partial [Microctonus aethiopoides]
MESIAVIKFNIFIPLEWMYNNLHDYEYILNIILEMTAKYADTHGTHSGCVIRLNNVEAVLFIDYAARIWWYRRIRIEDDPRPPNVNYYPPMASPEIEEWR